MLGYHGCDEDVGRALLQGKPFRASDNDYDWLGSGVYFWESNPQRALSFAKEQSLAFATGVKMSRSDLNVIVPMGDGDALAIGGNHFIHAIRRNMGLNILLFNNLFLR